MKPLNNYIIDVFDRILLDSNIQLVSDPVSIYTKDTNFILLSNYEQIGTLNVNHKEKKVDKRKVGLSIHLEINFGDAKRTFLMDYFMDENGTMLYSLFETLKKELQIWNNKTPLLP